METPIIHVQVKKCRTDTIRKELTSVTMAENKELVYDIKHQLLKCKVCLERMKVPRSLPCLHSYCTTCLETLAENAGGVSFLCPECRAVARPPGGEVNTFPKAFHLNYLLETLQLHDSTISPFQCCNKEDNDLHDPATIKCIECDAYYCKVCIGAHKLVRQTKLHTQVPLKYLNQDHVMKSAQKKVSLCDIHPESQLKYFCLHNDCNIPICQDCNAVRHKTHDVIELKVKATEYRTANAKVIEEDIQKAEEDLHSLKENIKAKKKETREQHKQNETTITERSQQIHKKVEEQESELLEEEMKLHGTLEGYFNKAEQEVDEKITSLQRSRAELKNINNFSPADEIARFHVEMKKKTQTVLKDASPPEVCYQSVSVETQSDPMLDMKQEVVKGKGFRRENALNKPIDSVVILTDLTIAMYWYVGDKASDVYVNSTNISKAKKLKEVIEQHCRQAYRMVPMIKDGKEKVVIVSTKGGIGENIKILHVDEVEIEDLGIDVSHHPYAIAVDEDNNIIYTTNTTPNTIRKKTENGAITLFTDEKGDEILQGPWYVTVNVNGDIIVSDDRKRSLIIFNKTGELVNTYTDFTPGDNLNPREVCTSPEGNIYVNDRNGDCIHCLDKTGKFLNFAVTKEDGLKGPVALQYCDDVLVVGQWNGQIKYYKI